MKCGCGAEYTVHDHGNGYIIRCVRWIMHKQKPNRKDYIKK